MTHIQTSRQSITYTMSSAGCHKHRQPELKPCQLSTGWRKYKKRHDKLQIIRKHLQLVLFLTTGRSDVLLNRRSSKKVLLSLSSGSRMVTISCEDSLNSSRAYNKHSCMTQNSPWHSSHRQLIAFHEYTDSQSVSLQLHSLDEQQWDGAVRKKCHSKDVMLGMV